MQKETASGTAYGTPPTASPDSHTLKFVRIIN